MYSSLLERAKTFLRAQRKKNIWYRLMTSMAVVVVFTTTYMLILPAITMERDAVCGIEEHTHIESCYGKAGVIVCGKDEHIHTDECYRKNGKGQGDVILEEAAGTPASTAAGADSTGASNSPFLMGVEEVSDPGLADDGLTVSGKDPVTDGWIETEAAETEEGIIEETEYVCGMEEHQHNAICYAVNKSGELIVVCGKEEHVHDDMCIKQETEAQTEQSTETETRETTVTVPEHNRVAMTVGQQSYIFGRDGAEHVWSILNEDVVSIVGEDGAVAELRANAAGVVYIVHDSITDDMDVMETFEVTVMEGETNVSEETEAKSEQEAQPETKSETEAEAESETKPEAETETETGTEQGTEEESETEQDTEVESGSETETETENMSEQIAEGVIGMKGDPTAESETESESESETEIESESETELITEAESESESETEKESDLTAEEESETEILTGLVTARGLRRAFLGARNTPADFTGYIKDVTGDGTKYDKLTDYYTTTLALHFKLTKVQAQQGPFIFTYPADIIVPEDLLNKDHYGTDEGGNRAFQYRFSKNENGTYSVTLDFLDSYLENCGDDITGKLDFEGELKGTLQKDDGSIEKDFSDKLKLHIDGGKIEYEKGETRNYDLKITKNVERVEGNVLRYTVTVTSMKGTPTDISLTDIWTSENMDISMVKNVVVKEQVYEVIRRSYGDEEKSLGELTEVALDHEFNSNENKLTMTLPQIEGQEPEAGGDPPGTIYRGKKYVIQYDYPIDTPLQNGTTYKANNTANATSEGPGEKLNVSADAEKTFTVEMLDKTGSYDANAEKISWKIQLNDVGMNIAGYQLTDSMLYLLNQSDLTISPNSGYEFVCDDAGKIKAIKFKESEAGTGKNNQKYTITYSTTEKGEWENKTVINNAILDPDPTKGGDEIRKDGKVEVPGKKNVKKELVSESEGESETQLTWKFSVEVPENGTPKDLVVEDILTDTVSDTTVDHYMTLAQIREWGQYVGSTSINEGKYQWLGKADANTFMLRDENGNWVKYSELSDHPETEKFTGFRFNMKEALYPADNPELTYHSCADLTHTQNDVTYRYRNQIEFGGKPDEKEYIYYKATKVQKMDGKGSVADSKTYSENGVVTWKVKVYMDQDLGDGTLKITDHLPDDVELEKLCIGGEDDPIIASVASDGTISVQDTRVQLAEGSGYNNGIVTLEIKKGDGQYAALTQGKYFWVTYTCRIKNLPESGKQTYTLLNTVDVEIGGKTYGGDEQQQEHTVTIPKKVIKMDDQNRDGSSETDSKDGTVVWKVKVNLNDNFSLLDISDRLPKDDKGNLLVDLVGISLGGDNNQTNLTVENGGISAPTDFPLDLSGSAYDTATGEVKLQLRLKADQTRPEYFSRDHALWVTYTCKMKQMPKPGESSVTTLKNEVLVKSQKPDEDEPSDYGNSEQTQTHTVRRPPRVVKMDGSQQERDTTTVSTDGTVTWKVKVYLEDDYDTLTVEDQLPVIEGADGPDVALVSLKYGSEGAQKDAVIRSDGTILAADGDVLEFTGSSYDAQTGLITLKAKVKDGSERPSCFRKGEYFWLTYTCKINQLPESGKSETHTLKNTVVVKKNEEDKEYGSDEQTQTHTVTTPETKKVDKSGEWDNGSHLLRYSIDINADGKDLLDGNDELTLEDIVAYRIEPYGSNTKREALLLQSSVQLSYAQKDADGNPIRNAEGHLIPGNPVPTSMWRWKYESKLNKHDSGKREHIITAWIPDGEALVFQYNYQVEMQYPLNWGKKPVDIENTATIKGVSQGEDKTQNNDEWEKTNTSGVVISSKGQYVFYKVDASNFGVKLSGAEFTVYEYDAQKAEYVDTGYKYKTENGTFSVKLTGGYSFEKNTAYYVRETKAPEGYQMPENPEMFYFHFPDSTVTETAYPDGETAAQFTANHNAVDLSESSHTAFCENTKTSADIVVNKKWLNDSGVDITEKKTEGSVFVKLYRKEHDVDPEESSSGGSQGGGLSGGEERGRYEVKAADGWTLTISNLPKKDTKEGKTVYYTYYVLEESADEYHPSYSNTDSITSGVITVTNTEPEGPKTTISVKKTWNENGIEYTEEHDPIEVELWKRKGEGEAEAEDTQIGNAVRLSGTSEPAWSYIWENLEPGTYYVKEITEVEGYTTKYIFNGEEHDSTAGMNVQPGGSVTIENTREKTSLTVTKKWVSCDGTEKSEAARKKLQDITVDLYRLTEEGSFVKVEDKTVVLGNGKTASGYSDGGWSYTWEALPKGTYCVKEAGAADGYSTVTYEVVSDGTSGGSETTVPSADPEKVTAESGTIQITNKEDAAEIALEKVWSDGSQKHSSDTVTVELYSSTISPDVAEQTEAEIETTMTSVKVAVTEWENSNNTVPDSGSVQVKIFRCDANGAVSVTDPVYTGTLTSAQRWSATVEDLTGTVTTNGEKEIKYYLVQVGSGSKNITKVEPTGTYIQSGESGTEKYVVVSGENPENIVRLKATLDGTGGGGGTGKAKTIKVKCANNLDGKYGDPIVTANNITADTIQIQIYYRWLDGKVEKPSFLSVKGLSITGPECQIGDSTRLTYIVSGLNTLSDSEIELTFDNGNTWPITAAESTWFVDGHYSNSIIPIDTVQTNAINVFSRAARSASAIAENAAGSAASLVIPKGAQKLGEIPLGTGHSQETNYSEGGWKYTWNNLPKTDTDGNPLYYYIKETSVEGYLANYSYQYIDGDKTKGIQFVTVTNTPTTKPEGSQITVKKEWSGYTLNSTYQNYEVTVKLLKDGVLYDTKTLSATPSPTDPSPAPWSYTWTGLPEGTYTVAEVEVRDKSSKLPVTGYTQSITANGATFTITNTSTTHGYVLPETGGPGTKLYTLGGILLTAIASLLIGIKNKRRKEEQGFF